MGYVPIPKDLKKVKTKVAFNLTRRQLIGFTLINWIYTCWTGWYTSLFIYEKVYAK